MVEANFHLAQHLAGRTDESYIFTLLDRFGLTARRNHWTVHLSGGEAARASLAVVLSTRPVLLVADEPTGEVDADTEALVAVFLIDGVHLFGKPLSESRIQNHSDPAAPPKDFG